MSCVRRNNPGTIKQEWRKEKIKSACGKSLFSHYVSLLFFCRSITLFARQVFILTVSGGFSLFLSLGSSNGFNGDQLMGHFIRQAVVLLPFLFSSFYFNFFFYSVFLVRIKIVVSGRARARVYVLCVCVCACSRV